MQLPQQDDYIDIHNHDGRSRENVFIVECLMAHEEKLPENIPGFVFTYGIHPWFLTENNQKRMLTLVEEMITRPEIIALGEAGFDKLRGPSMDLQRYVFEQQIEIAEKQKKPVIIHCVRSWNEVMESYKRLKPKMPWMIHGFRGNIKLAQQLISKGMFISIWFDFAIRKESSELMRNLPGDRFFLETDGADIDIIEIYRKVSADRGIPVDELRAMMLVNFKSFFNLI